MSDETLMKQLLADLDAAIEANTKRAAENGLSDCIGDCDAKYKACMDNAGSDLEKATCKGAYNRCITNC